MSLMDLPPGFRIPEDASGANWLEGRGFAPRQTVGDAFPPRFTDFVRILHPAHRRMHQGPARWQDAFAERDRVLSPDSSWFEAIGWDDEEFGSPEDTSLPQPEASVVGSILIGHTTRQEDCWFQWSPVGGLPFDAGVPLVRMTGPLSRWRHRRAALKRSRVDHDRVSSLPSWAGGPLVRGPLGSLIEAAPTPVPSGWWPADEAWLVLTEIDAVSTYVAGSGACVDALLESEELEVLRVDPSDRSVA